METDSQTKTLTNENGSYKPRLLRKTNSLTILAHPELIVIKEEPIINLCRQVIEEEIALGNPNPHIDNRLWKDDNLKGITVPGFENGFISTVYRFNLDNELTLNNKNIQKEAEDMGMNRIYTFLEALCVILEAILKREVDGAEKELIAYFNVGDTSFRICVCRRDKSKRLCIHVAEYRQKGEWYKGSGACFSSN